MLMIGQYEAAVEIACTGKHAVAASICKEINQVQIKSNTTIEKNTVVIRDNTSAAKKHGLVLVLLLTKKDGKSKCQTH